MAKIVLKRDKSENLKKLPVIDGQLSFTIDDGRIHLDYLDENNEPKRKTMYSGVLTFGNYSYDGTRDVHVEVYKGENE